MLPRLEAERQLSQINAMSAAFGGMSRSGRSRYLAGLERQATGRRVGVKASPAALAAIGIGVTIVGPDGLPIEGGVGG